MVEISVKAYKWNIEVNTARQSGGSAIIHFPSNREYEYFLSCDSATDIARRLNTISMVENEGERAKRLRKLCDAIEDQANSFTRLSSHSYKELIKGGSGR